MAVTTTSVAILDGTGASKSLATSTDPAGLQRSIVSLDSAGAAIYRAAATFTPFGTADRTVISFTGSATKTCRIKKIQVGGTSTASGTTVGIMSRTTALGAGGTVVTPTTAKQDSGTVAASTGVVKHYTTAAQSLGTGPTTLAMFPIVTNIVSSAATVNTIFPEAGGPPNQSIVLRGTSDFLEIGNNAGNVTAGAVLFYSVEWEEDAS